MGWGQQPSIFMDKKRLRLIGPIFIQPERVNLCKLKEKKVISKNMIFLQGQT